MTAFNRRSVWSFVRRNQIVIDLVLIQKQGEKGESFQFLFFWWFLPHILARTYSKLK